jgi:Uma2 family endonuclease
MAAREYPVRWSVEEYFGLVHRGVLHPDDRVELLEGLIVAMSPQNPRHAAAISLAERALRNALGERAFIRTQLPLVLGAHSAPEPDLAVVPGDPNDYAETHPRTALLVVEIADSSLIQDRLTKAAIYARAAIPEYWLVNLVDERVEVFREPLPRKGRYRSVRVASRGERIAITAFPGTAIAAADLLPRPRRADGHS